MNVWAFLNYWGHVPGLPPLSLRLCLHDVLHWLPVPLQIEFKICLLVYKSLHGAAPGYLRDYC